MLWCNNDDNTKIMKARIPAHQCRYAVDAVSRTYWVLTNDREMWTQHRELHVISRSSLIWLCNFRHFPPSESLTSHLENGKYQSSTSWLWKSTLIIYSTKYVPNTSLGRGFPLRAERSPPAWWLCFFVPNLGPAAVVPYVILGGVVVSTWSWLLFFPMVLQLWWG